MTSLSGVMPFASYSVASSSALLNVPSSRTVCAHGIDAAPGMWPARWAVSLMPGRRDDLAVELGRATDVDEGQARVAEARQDVVAEGAQAEVGLGQLVAGRARYDGTSTVSGEAVVEPVLAPAVEDADVAVAVQLELPVGPRREPVVVVAVEHDRRVGADARLPTAAR